MGIDLLPIIIPPVSLRELCIEVDEMACKEEVVLRRYGQSIAHERAGVDCESSCEFAGDTVCTVSTSC